LENPNGNRKPITAIFIDYEHWYYSLLHLGSSGPDMEALLADVKTRATLNQITVFGDFTQDAIKGEVARIRRYTTNIINCENSGPVQKNYTDFIMLDTVYQTLIMRHDIEQYIFVTGDGHFSSVMAHLRTFHDKQVGVYGVNGSFSNNLREGANWWVAIEPQYDYRYKHILDTIWHTEERKYIPSFQRMVENCAKYNGLNQDLVSATLASLINRGYISQAQQDLPGGTSVRALVTDWTALERDGLYSRDNNMVNSETGILVM